MNPSYMLIGTTAGDPWRTVKRSEDIDELKKWAIGFQAYLIVKVIGTIILSSDLMGYYFDDHLIWISLP